ncbi:hypothetical protein LIER_01418 [Lithospermum erythrorhizon]|uniref:Uncharacterized protein n=1 Tax=Lithospermum erythrorhizon TaxID=34254 RepID=A0AAV3NLC4_LITER
MAEKRKSRGVVLNFRDAKGYGFIKPDGAGEEEPDVFVHHSEVKAEGHRTLRSGQEVEFLMYQDGDKFKAVDVVVVGGWGSGGRGGDGFNRRIGNGYRGGNVGGGGGGGECYTCGKPGHFSRDCYETSGGNGGVGGGGSGVCYTCGGIGHLARECPTGRKRGCFNCGNPGHMAADCREIINGSYQSGGGGNAGGLGISSYGGNAGGLGFSRFGGNVKSCFNCGEQGHMAKDCQEVSRGGGSRGGNANAGGFSQRNCFKCGEPGHFARECLSVK